MASMYSTSMTVVEGQVVVEMPDLSVGNTHQSSHVAVVHSLLHM